MVVLFDDSKTMVTFMEHWFVGSKLVASKLFDNFFVYSKSNFVCHHRISNYRSLSYPLKSMAKLSDNKKRIYFGVEINKHM